MGRGGCWSIVTVIVLGALLPARTALAHPFFDPAYPVPNFTRSSCLTCHDDASTDYCADDVFDTVRGLNPFGLAFCANGQEWNANLAERDSDDDGWTNGQELGDPFGVWRPGDASPPYRSDGAPGDGAREPSNFDLCSSSQYNDCAGSGSDCVDTYDGHGRWRCTCVSPGWSGSSHSSTTSHDWSGIASGGSNQRRYDVVASGSSCSDVDECTSYDCGDGECVDLLGSFDCDCDAGAACTSFSGSLCRDCALGYTIDDCDSSPDACVPTLTAPFYSCVCPPGYEGTGVGASGCTNIPDCDGNPCGMGACTELTPPGTFIDGWGYTCACDAGYAFDASSGACVDIDECQSDPPLAPPSDGYDACSPGTCTEGAPATWSCTCPTNYDLMLRADGHEVCDFDECTDPSTSRCSVDATCANTLGAWVCTCNTGFRDTSGDGRVCDEIDECAEETDACHEDATCDNRPAGSYTCTCDADYRGSGFSCADIDECAEGTHGCGLNERCVNQEGMPNLCECQAGYVRDAATDACVVQCGDGVRGPGEACDDGNAAADDGCSDRCEIEDGWACWEPTGGASDCEETCGDGRIDAPFEECDDGAGNSDDAADACRTTCRFAGCGDGVVDGGEECDDGPENDDASADRCRTSCHLPYCGDGVVDADERCDPGGGVPGAILAGTCTTACAPDGGVDPDDPPVLRGGSGCGCRTASSTGRPFGGSLLLVGLALGLLRRRRRGSRSGRRG